VQLLIDPSFDDLVDALQEMQNRAYESDAVVEDLRETVKELSKRLHELELAAFHAKWDKQNANYLKHADK